MLEYTEIPMFFNEGHGAGTQWSCPPLSSIMAQRPYMQADTPAQTEQEGFDVPDMLSISSRNAGHTPCCQCSA